MTTLELLPRSLGCSVDAHTFAPAFALLFNFGFVAAAPISVSWNPAGDLYCVLFNSQVSLGPHLYV